MTFIKLKIFQLVCFNNLIIIKNLLDLEINVFSCNEKNFIR